MSGFIGSCAYAAEPVTIRLQVFDRPLTIARGAEAFLSAVNSRLGTAGRVEFVKEHSISPLSALFKGKADLVVIPTDELVDFQQSERFALFDLPFFFDKLDEVAAIQNGAAGDILLSSLHTEQLVGLGYWNVGFNQLFDRRNRIRDARDLKGIPFGTAVSKRALASTRSLQAEVILMSGNELTAALAAGRLDVADLSLDFAEFDSRNGGLPPTSIVLANYRPLVGIVATTREIWKKWSFQVQSVIAEEVRAASARITVDAIRQDRETLSELQKRGFNLVEPKSDAFQGFRALARPGWMLDNYLLDIALDSLQEYRRAATPVQRKALIPTTKTEILFATDRLYDSSLDAWHRFGSSRDLALGDAARLGVATFTPDSSSRQEVADQYTAMRFDAQPFGSPKEFIEALSSRLSAVRRKEILIYVHGYNVTLAQAAANAATLARGSKFAGVVVIFSWPSEASVPGYPADEEEVESSRNGFVEFVRLIRGIDGLERLHLLSHSMGSRLAALGLEWISKASVEARPLFHHVVFAAPDLYNFKLDRALPSISNLSDRITLYASERDLALKCSKGYHFGHLRAGQTGVNIVVRRLMNTIDVTNADPPRNYLICRGNHSYITQNDDVLYDLNQLINLNLEPARRNRLQPKPYNDLQYWEFN
jgi:esterase/lipase superfamily enzyme/TRAP-type C4-dicarboxylate transport system substrate-binding protein